MYWMFLEREITKQKNKIVFPQIIHAEQKIKMEVKNINPQRGTPFLAGKGSVMKNNP